MSEPEKQTALVPAQQAVLTTVGVKSLVARGSVDLRVKEEAEEWLKKGMAFYHNMQYEDAFECFERGIQLNPNHPELQLWLGNLLTNGEGVRQDYVQAATWWRKAAEQGLPKAQNNLACAYEFGQGVIQDYTQAAFWLRKAAEQGFAAAQYSLGFLYRDGQGVMQNYVEAALWWRKAAEWGLAEARYNLGCAYESGQGVPQDYAQAAEWYRKAAEQGEANAQCNLGLLYSYGQGAPQDYAESYFWLDLAASGLKGSEQTYAITCRDESASHLTSAELLLARERINRWHDGHIDIRAGLVPISGAIELDPEDIDNLPPNVVSSRAEVSN